MPRSHHRKKHKEHLNRFQESRKNVTAKIKSNPKFVFILIGAALGFLLFYLGGTKNIFLLLSGLLLGAFLGHLLEKKLQ